ARALVMEPSLLLADEPTGNLDHKTGSGIHDLFYELNERLKLTIVVVTHDPKLANAMPRRLVMEAGGLEPEDEPSEAVAPERLDEAMDAPAERSAMEGSESSDAVDDAESDEESDS